MARLTNDMRHEFQERVISSVFTDQIQAMGVEEDQLAKRFYERFVPEEHRKLMQGAPDGAFMVTHNLTLYLDNGRGCYSRVEFNLKSPLPVFANVGYGGALGDLWRDPVELELAKDFLRRHREMKEEIVALRKELIRLLKQVTTTNKLKEHWPMAVELVPAFFDNPTVTANLPAVRLDVLEDIIKRNMVSK